MSRYFIGLDGGSTYLKAAMIKDGRVIDVMVRSTGIDNNGTAQILTRELCSRNAVTAAEVGYIMATGYSRKVLEVADDDISEITAHAYGVRLTAPQGYRPGMIIDIGGQDSKIIYSFLDSNSFMRLSINLPASIATLSGLNGESPCAISSALTNSLHCRILGRTLYEAVVFPAPLGPLMI